MPDNEKFKHIERLSDAERDWYESHAGVHTAAEITPGALSEFEAEYTSKQPRPLSAAIDALSDADFKELMGWVLFGREYTPEDGDPCEVLSRYTQNAVIYPRDEQADYLEQKPIGKYLRKAIEHLETTTSEEDSE